MKALYTIVGMRHRGTEGIVKAQASGSPVLLEREPGNQYDRRAIKVHVRRASGEWTHVGYIKSSENRDLSERMDATAEEGKCAIMNAVLRFPGYPSAEVDE